MKQWIMLLMLSLFTVSSSWAGDAPDAKQIAVFAEAFEKAWNARNLDGIQQLIALEGVSPASADKQAGYWSTVIEFAQKKPEEWGGAYFQPLSEALAEKPGRNVEAIQRMVDGRSIRGRSYVQSVPVLGTMSLYIWGKSSVMVPVGLDRKGTLKIAVLKPVEGVTSADQIGELMEPQGFAKADPTEAAVAKFREQVAQALSTGKWEELYWTDGTPRDFADMFLKDYTPLWEDAEGMNYEIALTPASAMFAETQGSSEAHRKENYKPKKWGSRWYGFNLPIAGMVRITISPKEGEKGFRSTIAFPVGMTPSGELKIVLYTPVKAIESSSVE